MKPVRRQQGVTLVTALIMLVLLTLLALTSFNLGNSTLQVVSNMQQREQSVAAANQAIEETISSTNFFNTPSAALPNPDGAPNQRLVDTDADGKADIKVTISPPPSCVKAQVVKNSDLRLDDAEDAGCSAGASQSFGVAGATDGSSDCANSVWDVNAVATDMATNASVKVTQGVAVRVAKDDIATNCPQSGASQ
jgi:Tfp pilus assembly protein PilX